MKKILTIENSALFSAGCLSFVNNFNGHEIILMLVFIYMAIKEKYKSHIFKKTLLPIVITTLLLSTTISLIGEIENLYIAMGILYTKYIIYFSLIIILTTSQRIHSFISGYILGASISSFIMLLNYLGVIQINTSGDIDYVEIRQSAFMGDPNIIGAFLVFAIMLQIDKIKKYLSIKSPKKIKNFLEKMTNLIILAIMATGLVLTFSRGAWINLIISLIIYLFAILIIKIERKKLFKHVTVLTSILLLIGITIGSNSSLHEQIISRFEQNNYDEATNIRKEAQVIVYNEYINTKSIHKLLFGYGPRTSHIPASMNPHSTTHQVLYELGAIPLFIIATIMSMLITYIFKSLTHGNLNLILLISCFMGLIVHSTVVDTFYWRLPWILLALITIFIVNKRRYIEYELC